MKESLEILAKEDVFSFIVSPEMIDRNGHVNYLRYIELFEKAHDHLLNERGLDRVELLKERGLRMFVKAVEVEYKRELKEGAATIGTALELGKTSMTYKQTMKDAEGNIIASAKFPIVTVDEAGRPTPIPDEIRRAMAA